MIVIKTTASYMSKNNILEYSSIIEELFENITVYEILSKNPHFNIFAKIALGKCK